MPGVRQAAFAKAQAQAKAELEAWAASAPIGERRTYFIGLNPPDALAAAVRALYEAGLVLPFQRKLKAAAAGGATSYEIVRVSPRAARAFGFQSAA